MKKINLTFTLLAVLALFIVSCSGEKKPGSSENANEAAPMGKGQSAVVDEESGPNH